MVFHRCLPPSRNQEIPGSHLSYAGSTVNHDQSAVKVHGVFPSRCGHPASSPEPQIRRAVRQDSRSIGTPFVQVGTYPTRNFAHLVYSVSRADGLYLTNPVFIVEAIALISSMPSSFKCLPWDIRRRILRNLAKSTRFFDFSGCCSKKGTILSLR